MTKKNYSILNLLTFLFNVSHVFYVNYQYTNLHQDTNTYTHKHTVLFDKCQSKMNERKKKVLCMHQPSKYYTLYTQLFFAIIYVWFLSCKYRVPRVTKPSSHTPQSIQWHGVTFVNIYLTINQTWMQKCQIIRHQPCICVCMRVQTCDTDQFFFSCTRFYYNLYILIHATIYGCVLCLLGSTKRSISLTQNKISCSVHRP